MKTLTLQSVPVHSMFRGDANRIHKRVVKAGANQVLNQSNAARFEMLAIDQLVPLETQRETNGNWAQKRLTELGGFDMVAAGALSVALDPTDNIYYVFDGCGRLAQAQQTMAVTHLPCLVYDIPKQRAAFYFAYNQDRGRRSLSKEVIFVNAYYSGEAEAVKWAGILTQIECYIKGTTDYAVPHPQQLNHPEIKYRAVTEGYRLADGDITLMKEVRDLIWKSWSPTPSKCEIIRQDLFWGLIYFFKVYPEARENGLKKAVEQFLAATAMLTTQGKLTWKQDGGNKHNHEAQSVASGFVRAFRGSQYFKPSFNAIITQKRVDKEELPVATDEE